MPGLQIVVQSYFDGSTYHPDGPFTLTVQDGCIHEIRSGERLREGMPVRRAAFLMPGLVEAHSHLFLDGGELDSTKRAAYLKAPRDEMLAVARQSVWQSLEAGVTLVRDAGDIHGINLSLREEQQVAQALPRLLCAGRAIRNARRYGSFMAQELTEQTSPEQLVSELAVQADQIKILMTGIIDFEVGAVLGAPQFTLEQATRMVSAARAHGRRTFAHCSGVDGIALALAAGIDSIEHGFFVTRAQLQTMADRQVSWVPTFSPVYFQWARPEIVGWSANALGNLERILDDHRRQLDHAYALGVPVLVGSDAGSMGVPHGSACVDELMLMADAGIALSKLLHSATALARRLWDCAPTDIVPGCGAEIVLFDQSPFDDLRALRRPSAVLRGSQLSQPETILP